MVAGRCANLAQRSARPPQGNQGPDRRFGREVETGSRLVDQAGATMEEVVGSVKRVSTIISEIAAASDEQRGGIEQ
ncbi:methyl-accepting chemotaxis protein [Massilia sp. WF1]|uniref:methyl-accepting chemotaxis protein n=1 Tax=Massilia sp. WF1 TaxID=1406431 RepID=UPI000A41D99E|nr:methyl-accepting chemotaxis protein [Massilia sp. WF1]